MKKHRLTNILFILPTLLSFTLIVVIPFFMGIYYSLTDWNGVSRVINFVGLQNYRGMFSSPDFLYSLKVTVFYTVINIVLVNLVGFCLALLATSNLRLRNLYRAGFFVPNLIGGIVLGYIWQFMFNNVFVSFAAKLGISFMSKSMLSSPKLVIWAMSIVNTWQYGGYIMMIYVAGIQGIPSELMEAASVDGANYGMRLRKILIPMLSNSFTICLFLTLINSFKQYDMNFSLTNGGPAALFMGKAIRSSELLAMNIYNTANLNNKLAIGQAKAVVFFLMLVVVSLVQVSFNKRREVEL